MGDGTARGAVHPYAPKRSAAAAYYLSDAQLEQTAGCYAVVGGVRLPLHTHVLALLARAGRPRRPGAARCCCRRRRRRRWRPGVALASAGIARQPFLVGFSV